MNINAILEHLNSDARQNDILELAKAVLYMPANYFDNPNGAYETICPFCGNTVYRGGGEDMWASMSDINHATECPYLVAKDLITGLVK